MDAEVDIRSQSGWRGRGVVVNMRSSIAEAVLHRARDPPDNTLFTIKKVVSDVPNDRLLTALRMFAVDDVSVDPILYRAILGDSAEPYALEVRLPASWPKVDVPGRPPLNTAQLQSVHACLTRTLSITQGPPGTGKTEVIIAAVYFFAKQRKGQVLVVAASNAAVDLIANRLHTTGLSVGSIGYVWHYRTL